MTTEGENGERRQQKQGPLSRLSTEMVHAKPAAR